MNIALYTTHAPLDDSERSREIREAQRRNEDIFTAGLKKESISRVSYGEMFEMANEDPVYDYSVIANGDISFDETLLDNIHLLGDCECWALSRWDLDNRGRARLFNHPDSQDAWIFKGKIDIPKEAYNIKLGIPGCDNRIAFELHQQGYNVTNPSKTVKAYHHHASGARNYDRKQGDVVHPPYLKVFPCKLPIKKKNLLHVTLDTDKPQHGLNRALDRAYNVTRYHWQGSDMGTVTDRIIEQSKEIDADVIFMQIQREGVIDHNRIRQAQGFIINWTGDVREPLPKWYKDVGRNIDLTLFSNMKDVHEMSVDNINVNYLDIGFDQKIYKPEGEKIENDIVFLGNNYPHHFPLSDLRNAMVDRMFLEFGGQFQLFGSGWGGHEHGNFNNDPEMEAAILRGAKLVINLSHFNYERYSSDRILRAMGCGSMVLSHAFKGLGKDYTPNRHLAQWHDLDELVKQAKYYLTHPQNREEIASAGCNLVHSFSTWDARIKDLQTMIFK